MMFANILLYLSCVIWQQSSFLLLGAGVLIISAVIYGLKIPKNGKYTSFHLFRDNDRALQSFYAEEDNGRGRNVSEQLKGSEDSFEERFEESEKKKEMLKTQLIQSQKMAAIGQLAGGVAHEINNPLGVILGFSQSIVKRIKESDPLYMPITSIEREAIRCKKLAGDLLAFSRSPKTYPEIIDINKTIEETLSLVEAQAKVKNIEIIKEYGTDMAQITVNKNQVQQVVINLCNNAMDAMPDGGKITITTKQDNSQIEIDVADTGQGMPAEIKRHIFEPFYTTKEAGKGTGLGLSLCYETIQKHNGTIEVESEIGKGTTFTIKLPVNTER